MIWDVLVLVAVLAVAVRLAFVFKTKISFFAAGNDNGFRFSEVRALWRLAKEAEMQFPEDLFHSLPLVSDAISRFVEEIRRNGTESLKKNQDFLSRLYAYRTRISLEHENAKGLLSTKYLSAGQKLRIVLPGRGVHLSEIIESSTDLFVKVPRQRDRQPVDGASWVGHEVSVYLWRKGDAGYVFDSKVLDAEVRLGSPALRLRHSSNLLRTQKRKSIRAKCQLDAQLYFISGDEIDFDRVETSAGFRCVVEDISEDGALIRVGGRGEKGVGMKIQFNIGDSLVCMFGVVRAVEYNSTFNQSRLHFECVHLDEPMKNQVLSFVYRVLPEKQKEEADALAEIEAEEAEAEGRVAPAPVPVASAARAAPARDDFFEETLATIAAAPSAPHAADESAAPPADGGADAAAAPSEIAVQQEASAENAVPKNAADANAAPPADAAPQNPQVANAVPQSANAAPQNAPQSLAANVAPQNAPVSNAGANVAPQGGGVATGADAEPTADAANAGANAAPQNAVASSAAGADANVAQSANVPPQNASVAAGAGASSQSANAANAVSRNVPDATNADVAPQNSAASSAAGANASPSADGKGRGIAPGRAD